MTAGVPETPPRLPILGGAQLTLKFNVAGQDGAMVLGALIEALDADAARKWQEAAWNALRPIMGSAVTGTSATVRRTEPDGMVFELPAPTNAAGAGGTGIPSLAICTVLRWSSSTGGRTGKGRTFVPGVTQGMLGGDARTIAAAHQTTAATAITTYLGNATLAAEGVVPAVLSFRRGAGRPITGGSVQSVMGVQRRRLR